jgi:hypothetical protein
MVTPYAPSASICGHKTSAPTPFRKIPRTISMKYLPAALRSYTGKGRSSARPRRKPVALFFARLPPSSEPAGSLAGSRSWWRAPSLEGLALGLRGSQGSAADGHELLYRLFADRDDAVHRASLSVLAVTDLSPAASPVLQRAALTAADPAASPDVRADSLGLLALSDAAAREALFRKLIAPPCTRAGPGRSGPCARLSTPFHKYANV